MKTIKAGIINVTGYAGVELARLLSQHPNVELTEVTGRSAAGSKLGDVFPHLADIKLTIAEKLTNVDVAFSALPHKDSAATVIPFLEKGIKVVDISADFRLNNPSDYHLWYGFDHPAPELLDEAVYGLPELYRSSIKTARLVANPGCYPTSAILSLIPALRKELLMADFIIIDSKSGISGAGRGLSLTSHFSEATQDTTAYALSGHRHLPEIVQELQKSCTDKSVKVTFVPHLIPMTRGILTTAYAPLSGNITADDKGEEELRQIYREFYKDEPFVRVVATPPHTKHTWGSNFCLIYPTIDKRTDRLVVISCIDNLVKGAAGQAIQNMNLMFGLGETAGLEALAVFP